MASRKGKSNPLTHINTSLPTDATISHLVYHPINSNFLIASNDKSNLIKVYNLQKNQDEEGYLSTIDYHHTESSAGIITLAISPNGKNIVTAADDDSHEITISPIDTIIKGDKKKGEGEEEEEETNDKPEPDTITIMASKPTCIVYSPTGSYLAIAAIDIVKIINMMDQSQQYTFTAHAGPIRSISYSPNGDYLATIGGADEDNQDNQVLRIWNTNELSSDNVKPIFEHSLSNLSKYQFIPSWNPNSKILSIPIDNSIVCFGTQDKEWKQLYSFENDGHTKNVLYTQWSPNGSYLASCGMDKNLLIWSVDEVEKGPVGPSIKQDCPIHTLQWKQNSNIISFMDSKGHIGTYSNVIPQTMKHPSKGSKVSNNVALSELLESPDQEVDEQQEDEEQQEEEQEEEKEEKQSKEEQEEKPSRLKRIKKQGSSSSEKDKKQDVDDSFDINNSDDDQEEEEKESKSTKKSSEYLDDMASSAGEEEELDEMDTDNDGMVSDYDSETEAMKFEKKKKHQPKKIILPPPKKVSTISKSNSNLSSSTQQTVTLLDGTIYTPIQPGSTFNTVTNRKRYFMAYNMTGCIVKREEEDPNQPGSIEIEFNEVSFHRKITMVDNNNFELASLGEKGAIFASQKKSLISFKPFDGMDINNDWTYSLGGVIGVAIGNKYIVTVTDQRMVRVFTLGGCQYNFYTLGGDFITMAISNNDVVAMVYSMGTNQLHLQLQNLKDGNIVYDGLLAISPKSTLKWIGFSSDSNCTLTTTDSIGIVRQLVHGYLSKSSPPQWTPILDYRQVSTKSTTTYWTVGCSSNEIYSILSDTEYPSTLPRPVLAPIKMKLPLLNNPDLENQTLEEVQFKHKLLLNSIQSREITLQEHLEFDSNVLRLFNPALNAKKYQRAIDLCTMLHLKKSLLIAIKCANTSKVPLVTQQLNGVLTNNFTNDSMYSNIIVSAQQQPQYPQPQPIVIESTTPKQNTTTTTTLKSNNFNGKQSTVDGDDGDREGDMDTKMGTTTNKSNENSPPNVSTTSTTTTQKSSGVVGKAASVLSSSTPSSSSSSIKSNTSTQKKLPFEKVQPNSNSISSSIDLKRKQIGGEDSTNLQSQKQPLKQSKQK